MSDKEWEVGDRVQYEGDDQIFGGAITALVTGTRNKEDYSYRTPWKQNTIVEKEQYTSHLVIKWDDGEEETLDYWDVASEDNEMERTFRVKAMEVTKLIDAELNQAHEHLRSAVKLSEEHGISFGSGISPLAQSYIATTFKDKWPDVEQELANGITDTYSEYDNEGWQHSAVC